MSIGRLAQPREEANDQPWAEDVRFWVGRERTGPVPLASAAAWVTSRATDQVVIALTEESGVLIVASGIVAIRVPKSVMISLPPGIYDVELCVGDATGGHQQVRWVMEVFAGAGA